MNISVVDDAVVIAGRSGAAGPCPFAEASEDKVVPLYPSGAAATPISPMQAGSPRYSKADDPGILVLPDMAVLGDRPGQELRRWVLAEPTLKLVLPLNPPTPTEIKSARQVVAFGTACGNPDLNGAKVIFIHPYESPPENLTPAKGSVLMLPGIDLARQNAAWRDWAGTQAGMEVKEDAGTALDIRVRWPEVMLAAGKL